MQLNNKVANRELDQAVVAVATPPPPAMTPPAMTLGDCVAAAQPNLPAPQQEAGQSPGQELDDEAYERAAAIFRALGDPRRLRMLDLLKRSEYCVSDLSQLLDEPMPAISQRLRLLKSERIVRSRRVGKRVYYALADEHISQLVSNALLHAME
ncbi:ArsR/SmtB family transcription factor [Planctomycetaceae bacterium SH139]